MAARASGSSVAGRAARMRSAVSQRQVSVKVPSSSRVSWVPVRPG
jgi:hypothetical protein